MTKIIDTIQNFFLDLIGADEMIYAVETFFSGLNDFNKMLFIVGTAVLMFIGLFQIFKKILKLTSGLIKVVLFIVVLYFIANIVFNL